MRRLETIKIHLGGSRDLCSIEARVAKAPEAGHTELKMGLESGCNRKIMMGREVLRVPKEVNLTWKG